MIKILDDISNNYKSISLGEMDAVKLMNRIDTKYVIGRELLPYILEKISSEYRILEIDDKKIFPYKSLYYDTHANTMYLAHHNGQSNRYKIRLRKYLASDLCFLEIKIKVKGNRTIKHRTKIGDLETTLSENSGNYIEKYSPFQQLSLEPKIYTNFTRITLVNNNLTERVTIDLDLNFKYNGTNRELPNVAIIELKRDAAAGKSPLINALSFYRIFPSGFSKYCIGRAMIENEIKKNNFKERILTINKINDGKFYYSNLNKR